MAANIKQIRHLVVIPTLEAMAEYTDQPSWASDEAVELVMGTGYYESRFEAIRQYARRGGARGPARGMWQVEHPRTHQSLWKWLERRGYHDWVQAITGIGDMDGEALMADLRYGSLMCRVKYRTIRSPLPTTFRGMGEYYKRWYNTSAGSGTISGFVAAHRQMRRIEPKYLL